ncbi:MAG: ArsR/SmtB family transcription factor [Bacteroidales bacterium]
MKRNFEQLAECMKALGHPIRLQIVEGLIKDECNVSEIQNNLNLPQSTISQHLRILKNASIITNRREGNKVCYKVLDNWVKEIINENRRQ